MEISELFRRSYLLGRFVECSKKKDYKSLRKIIRRSGSYEIQDEHLNTITTSRKRFLDWYLTKLNDCPLVNYRFSKCCSCEMEGVVVLFNYDEFPRIPKYSFENKKCGYLLLIERGKISGLKFCYGFKEGNYNYI